MISTLANRNPYRWYYKDCVAWFIEAPGDTIDEKFSQGDHAFCFMPDTTYREHPPWWRHGNVETSYIEEAIPAKELDYAIKLFPGSHDFHIEARISWKKIFTLADPNWNGVKLGQLIRLMIVHTDPDGGDYGGHLLIYGQGDQDNSWTWAKLSEAQSSPVRRLR